MSDSTAPVRIAVAIDVVATAVELVADRLFSEGASAVAESDQSDGSVTLIADLEVDAVDRLSWLRIGSGDEMTIRVLEPDAAWNNGWREFAKTRRCGRVVIRPAWLPAEGPVGSVGDDDDSTSVELVMEPGESFGSGTHVTTRLCVEAVDRLVTPGAAVLDVGCGTGVLGVAAALLGSGTVTAIDIEAEAVAVTRELATMNGVSDRVTASTSELTQIEGRFDLVLANVLLPVIEELGWALVERLAPEGRLVVSGVLAHQRDRTEAALAPLAVGRVEEREGWLLLEFARHHRD